MVFEVIQARIMSNFGFLIYASLLLVLFTIVQIYKGATVKQKLLGGALSFLISHVVLYSLAVVIYGLVESLLPKDINVNIFLIIQYLVFIILILLNIYLYVCQIKLRNRIVKVNMVEPMFGVFVYTMYITNIILTLCFSSTTAALFVSVTIFTGIWYMTFRNNFEKIMRIYPHKIWSDSNETLIIEMVLVLLLWFIPASALANGIAMETMHWSYWVSALAIVMYIYCISSHKIIFNDMYHNYLQKKNLSTDRLTGLMTRMAFTEEGQRRLDAALEAGRNAAVAYINIDKFKFYNLNHGNEHGDQLLISIADALRRIFGDEALISRLSSDHFTVYTEDLDKLEVKLKRLALHAETSNGDHCVKVKIGIYKADGEKRNITEITDCAMIACNNVHLESGQDIRFYDEDISNIEKLNHYVINNIDRAIEEGLLQVFYQPIVTVESDQINSAEALIRWRDDNYGFLTPNSFIPVLEKDNLTYKIACFVIEQVCKDIIKARELGHRPVPVGINISRKDFFMLDMVDYVDKTVNKYGLEKSLIKIEITESAMTDNDSYIAMQTCRFVELGYKVWMDDFGSGYSSLNAVGDFKFTGIKLDMVFLKNLSVFKAALMSGIIETAKKLGLEVLVEGVETEEHVRFLKRIKCENAQGYWYSKPMSFDDYIKKI